MRTQTKSSVLALLTAHQAQLRSAGVKRIGLFGSFARGEPRDDSDVDLLVEFEPDRKTFTNFMQLWFDLQDLLGRPVELVTPESLSPYIGPRITAEVEYVPLAA
ncbi:MAG: nucleotidyltransferase family protein [Chloroflexi bacterium]|nr:nucleotidyltransferase family protein [Chloroflexota bacterium]